MVGMKDVAAALGNNLTEVGKGPGDISQVDCNADHPSRFGKTSTDDPIDEVDIDVSSTDDQYARRAFDVYVLFQESRQRRCSCPLGNDSLALNQHQNGRCNFVLLHRDNFVDAALNDGKCNAANALYGDSIGNARDGFDRNDFPLLSTQKSGRSRSRLDTNDVACGSPCFNGRGNTRDTPSTADWNDDCVCLRKAP
jgi:hypothetical protein